MVEYIHSKGYGITASKFYHSNETIQILKYWNICQENYHKILPFLHHPLFRALILIYRQNTKG